LLAATEIVEGANTNMNFPLAQKIIAGEKIFLNVSRCRDRSACMAGVLTSRVLPQSSVVRASLSPTNKVAYSIFATLQNC